MTLDNSAPSGVARDWHVLGGRGGVELVEPFGEIVARGKLSLPPGWQEEAERLGHVVVVYGPNVGVRSPKGKAYNDADRRAELDSSRRFGFAAWGVVAWLSVSRREVAGEEAKSGAGSDGGSTVRDVDDLSLLKDKTLRMKRFSVYVADAISALIDQHSLEQWVTNLWPVRCQTCGHALGAKADVSVDGVFDHKKILVTMHHATCRPSGTTPPKGVRMTSPTTSCAATWLGDVENPSPTDIPIMVINPSCEHLVLARVRGGGWRNATLDEFAKLGFAPPDGTLPRRIRRAEARLSGSHLTVSINGRRSRKHDWSLPDIPEHLCEQLNRISGLAIALTTKTLPTRLGPSDLMAAFREPEALAGWVPLARR